MSFHPSDLPHTLGALKNSKFADPERAVRSVKDEIRENLLERLKTGEELFC